MVDPERGIKDLGSFAAKIQEILQRVCAVELADNFGTGFLIGPETILTNYHVVEKAIARTFDPANVRVRFDYQRLRDNLTTNAGVTFELAQDWLVHAEKYSAVDSRPYDEARLPGEHELDYAVLRTREKVGLSIPDGPIESQRGWISPRAQPFEFPDGAFLMVVQHPCHDPISFDDTTDAVVRTYPNGTRVHYRTNTMPGSSGSPVLNRDLELVALHHSGEPGSPDFRLECHQQVDPGGVQRGHPDRDDPGACRCEGPRLGLRIGGAVRLSSGSFATVSGALREAFSASGDFRQLARCIDKSLQDITDPNGRTPDLVLALIECAETADAVEQLIACAKKQNPDNRRLAAIDVSALEEAAGTQQVVAAGGGASAFKQRLMEALGYLDTPGMQAVAGHELAALVETASDTEAETLHLALLGTVRASRPDEVVAELAPVVSDSLRRRIGDGKRPESLKLDLAPRASAGSTWRTGLHKTDLAFADLRHADLTNANLWRSRAYGVDVTKAGLVALEPRRSALACGCRPRSEVPRLPDGLGLLQGRRSHVRGVPGLTAPGGAFRARGPERRPVRAGQPRGCLLPGMRSSTMRPRSRSRVRSTGGRRASTATPWS